MIVRMRRREFVTLLAGTAAAWPLAARAQTATIPVVGFLNSSAFDANRQRVFHQALREAGYTDGRNVTIEYRWAENDADRLPALAAELVRRQVAVIVTGGNASSLASKAATSTIPIVFAVSEDPIKMGLVSSLARPSGNVTGINFYASELSAKRLELLRQLVPGAARIAVLVNPAAPIAATTARDVEAAAGGVGLHTKVLNVSSSGEINAAFAGFMRERPDALFVSGGFLFNSRRVQLALLAAQHSIPATYANRDFTEAGGLMSYGSSLSDAYRQVTDYAVRIIKGAKPADLPVVQSSKFELVINAETARMLGLTVPPSLLAIADEVIE